MNIIAIIKRVVKELLRDKRTLALMFVAPLVVLALMYFIFNGDEENIKIGIEDSVSRDIVDELPSDDLDIQTFETHKDISKLIEDNNLDGFLYEKDDTIYVTYTNEDPSKSNVIKQMLGSAIQKNQFKTVEDVLSQLPQLPENTSNKTELDDSYLYGDADSTYFDKMFPILIGFFVFLFVFLISGIGLLRERTTGTLERILATSIRRSDIVLGYLIGYGIFAVIQTLIIVLFSIYLLDVTLAGNIMYVILINILLAITALSMGIFVSTFANSEFQMFQFIPIIVVPQVFFSGIFPLENMPNWLSNIGYFFPLRYAGNSLTHVMIKGHGWSYISLDILILLIFITIFIVLNIVGLKRYRKV